MGIVIFMSVLRFVFHIFKVPAAPVTAASGSAAAVPLPIAKAVFAALDQQHFAVYQRLRQLFSGAVVNSLHRGAGNIHLRRALLLRKSVHVNQPDGLKLIHRHRNGIVRMYIQRTKPAAFGETADSSPLSWSWHCFTSFQNGNGRSVPRLFPLALQTFQLPVNVRKPVLQRVLLQLKKFFAMIRRHFLINRKPPKAAAKASPAGHTESKTKSGTSGEISSPGAEAKAPSGHCAGTHRAGSVSSWHFVHLLVVSDICRLQILL